MASRSGAADADAVRRAAVLATLAPSIGNTQPWRLVVGRDFLEVHADLERRLPSDPQARHLAISCGCALLNARVSLAASGVVVGVSRLPEPRRPALLATVHTHSRPGIGPADRDALSRLAHVIDRRRTNRREFASDPVPAELIGVLVGAAEAEGSGLYRMDHVEDDVARQPCLLVLGSRTDDPPGWVRAGEALERVLLEIARHGFTATPIARPVEQPDMAARLRSRLGMPAVPQLVVRVGRAAPTPAPRRRRLVEMLTVPP